MLQLGANQFLVWVSIRNLVGVKYISSRSSKDTEETAAAQAIRPRSLQQSKMPHQRLAISWVSLVLLASPLVAIWELEKDVYVVELDWYPDAPGETVVLTCDTPEEDGITWTSEQSSEVLGSGKMLTIQVKEFGDAGQYSCHRGGEVLSHSLLLLHKKEDGMWSTDILKDQKEPKNKTFLKCEATNYSGHFTCWWLTAVSTDVKFSVKSSNGSSDPRRVTCGAVALSTERVRVDHREHKKYWVECQEDSACPAAEERLPIELVVGAVHKLKYENYTSSFFIRDIIKPDPPKNLKLKSLKSQQVEVSWEYPDTWSTPHSYFSLTFSVQVQGKNKREKKERLFTDKTFATVPCHKDAKVRVQARDRYYSSLWSEWASVSCT